MRNIIIVFFAAALLSSCGLYSTFKSPELPSNALCGDSVEVQDTLAAIPSWREMFTEPQLQRLIELGLTANSDLRVARLKIEQAEASLLGSKLAFAPSFSVGVEGGVTQFGGSSSATYSVPLTMQWEVDLFGKLRNSKEQARAGLLGSVEYARMVQTQLVASIANGYYTLIMLDEQLSLTRQSVENQRLNLQTIIAMKEAGMQNEAAVSQASANYYQVQAAATELNRSIRVVENSLVLLVNDTPHAVERGAFDDNLALGATLSDSISIMALANRPDVKGAEYDLRRSFYGVNLARAAFYPSLSLGGSVGWSNNAGVVLNPGSLLLSALGSLTQPLFNRGANRANLKIAKSQYEQSLIMFQKSLLVAGNEVNDALSACQSSAEKLVLREQQVRAGERAVVSSQELMTHGSSTYLEVLVAQSTLLQSQLTQVTDWFEGVQGRVNLYKALGGGVN